MSSFASHQNPLVYTRLIVIGLNKMQVRAALLLLTAGIAAHGTHPGTLEAQSRPVSPALHKQPLTLPLSLPTNPFLAILQQTQPPPSEPTPTQLQSPYPAYPAPEPPRSRVHRSPRPVPAMPAAYSPYDRTLVEPAKDIYGSVYIPLDYWIYPAMVRLYEMGYCDTMFLGMRPWTRRSVLRILNNGRDQIMQGNNEQAKELLAALLDELSNEQVNSTGYRPKIYGLQSAYTRLMGINGTILRDSYHLGQTIANDYGRPYETGFNGIGGFSTVAEAGRLSLYVRGEYQHAPSGTGYSQSLANELSNIDGIAYYPPGSNDALIPTGALAAQNPFRLVEATLSYHLLGHEISGGKSDAWLGPAEGGAMAWSNNAENIYSFRIDRIEPLHVPLLSRLLGPLRYDFFYGSLKGHTDPNAPYIHAETFSFSPTSNFQFAFERTVIFGGQGHAPVTLHLFLKSFFSFSDTNEALKFSRDDPGARYSDYSMSYRLPFVRKYATFYADSISHDDVSPISAPRRAAYRTGIDISQIPGARRFELRVEAVSTDPGVSPANNGVFNYYETIQRQGYTNKGNILGDWIGREAKGGQAWLTYHISPQQWIQVEYLNKKTPANFIPGGTTQNQFKATVVKRFHRDYELNAWGQYEGWKAPIYLPGRQNNYVFAGQLTWFPKLHTSSMPQ